MKATDIIKTILKNRGMRQVDLVEPLGVTSPSTITQYLKRDMQTSTLVRFTEALDCDLIIKDRNTKEEWEIEKKFDMTATETIKAIMKEKDIKQIDLIEPLGVTSQPAVSQYFNRDLKTSTLTRFANALNCDLIIRDRQDGEEWKVE